MTNLRKHAETTIAAVTLSMILIVLVSSQIVLGLHLLCECFK